eukprot:1645530-Alexandrium_andersonii.AAC.1
MGWRPKPETQFNMQIAHPCQNRKLNHTEIAALPGLRDPAANLIGTHSEQLPTNDDRLSAGPTARAKLTPFLEVGSAQ